MDVELRKLGLNLINVNITDITDYVKELNLLRQQGIDITDKLPNEDIYYVDNI